MIVLRTIKVPPKPVFRYSEEIPKPKSETRGFKATERDTARDVQMPPKPDT